MSSSLLINIGPYLLVRKIKIKVDDVRQVCVNSDCSNFEHKEVKAPFCPQCGEKIVHKTFQKDDYKNVWNAIIYHDSKYEDELFRAHNGGCEISDDWDIYVPNHHIPNGIAVDEDSDEAWAEIKPDRMQTELDWFKEQYKDFLAVIVKEFGEENVKIQWGIVKHYN